MLTFISGFFFLWVILFIPILIHRTYKIIQVKKKGLEKDFTFEMDDLMGTKGDFKDYVDTVKSMFVFVLITSIIFIPCFYNFLKIERNVQDYIEEVEYADLYSLKDNLTTTGKSSMLSSGHIDGKLYYFYTTKYKDGFIQDKLNAYECYIIEDDNTKPRIMIAKVKNKEDLYVFLFNGYFNILPEKQFRIIIPKNSMTRDFKIDNE